MYNSVTGAHVIDALHLVELQGPNDRVTIVQLREVICEVIAYANKAGFADLKDGDQIVVVSRRSLEPGNALDDQRLAARAFIVGDAPSIDRPYQVCSWSCVFHLHLFSCISDLIQRMARGRRAA
jgi:hypothetical protein